MDNTRSDVIISRNNLQITFGSTTNKELNKKHQVLSSKNVFLMCVLRNKWEQIWSLFSIFPSFRANIVLQFSFIRLLKKYPILQYEIVCSVLFLSVNAIIMLTNCISYQLFIGTIFKQLDVKFNYFLTQNINWNFR